MRLATTQERRSRARSGIFLSILVYCFMSSFIQQIFKTAMVGFCCFPRYLGCSHS